MSRGEFTILDSFTGKQSSLVLLSCQLAEQIKAIQSKNVAALATINKTRIARGEQPLALDPRPTAGDFAASHRMFLTTKFKPYVAHAYSYVPVESTSGGNMQLYNSASTQNKLRFAINKNPGTFLGDMCIHIRLDAVDGGDTIKYKYCDYPGIRLIKHYDLSYNGLPIDEYHRDDMIFYYNFDVTSDKRPAWNRCLGQSDIKHGTIYDGSFGGITRVFTYLDGYQTPKFRQPALDLYIPLLFWFNLTYENSFVNVAARSSQKYIDVSLESLANILQATDIAGNPIPLDLLNLRIARATLYTRNYFVDPIISDLFVSKNALSLIRVHKSQYKETIENNGQILFNNFKYLVESMRLGFRPIANDSSFTNWFKFSTLTTREMPEPLVIFNPIPFPINQLVIRTSFITETTPVIENISFYISGNFLYKDTPSGFFNAYAPYNAQDIVAPSDNSVYLISFNLNQSVQPSGFLNLSQARETYLTYRNSTISALNPVTFICAAQTLAIIEYHEMVLLIKYVI